jgi:hypothetical protein
LPRAARRPTATLWAFLMPGATASWEYFDNPKALGDDPSFVDFLTTRGVGTVTIDTQATTPQ